MKFRESGFGLSRIWVQSVVGFPGAEIMEIWKFVHPLMLDVDQEPVGVDG
jgi:hypothetical protein